LRGIAFCTSMLKYLIWNSVIVCCKFGSQSYGMSVLIWGIQVHDALDDAAICSNSKRLCTSSTPEKA
jgi:hypothetical protein